jgi:nucleotide-binding universal stress UspA family protein
MERAGLTTSDGTVHVVAAAADDAAASIALLASHIGADVIVVGPHRQRDDTSIRTIGHTALMLVRRVSMPCMIVTQPLRLPLRRVIVAVDLSDTARGALLVALSWASALRVQDRMANTSTTLTALLIEESAQSEEHARSCERALEDELNRLRSKAGAWAGVTIEGAFLASENVAVGIVGYSKEHHADLVVLGTRGLGLNAEDRLGSVPAAAMQQISASALLVPPAVWSSLST